MSETTEVEKVAYSKNDLEQAREMRGIYSSIKSNSFDQRLAILKLVNEAEPIDEHIGEVFELVDVVVQSVDSVNDETGEVEKYERVILISEDGHAYVGASTGLMNSIRTAFRILGEPAEWEHPLPVTVTKEGPKMRQYFRLNLA